MRYILILLMIFSLSNTTIALPMPTKLLEIRSMPIHNNLARRFLRKAISTTLGTDWCHSRYLVTLLLLGPTTVMASHTIWPELGLVPGFSFWATTAIAVVIGSELGKSVKR